MCKVYGYARISTAKQSIERQVRNIQAVFPSAIIRKEEFTGMKLEGRKELEKILKAVCPGDTVVFDSVSRMSRDAAEGFKLYKELFDRGIELVFLKERYIDTATLKEAQERRITASVDSGEEETDELIQTITEAINRYMMRLAEKQIKIAFEQAQKEVDDLHQRTREGIETARLNGKQIGQRQGAKLVVKKAAPAKEIIRTHSKSFGGTLSDDECMKLTGLARNTYYKYKRELKEAQG